MRNDPCVISLENINARYIRRDDFETLFDVVTLDVSFISQRLIYRSVCEILKDGGDFLPLIKPQFEVGRGLLPKNGVVTSKKDHFSVIKDLFREALTYGLSPAGLMRSPIRGGSGNIEYLAHFRKTSEGDMMSDEKIEEIIEQEDQKV